MNDRLLEVRGLGSGYGDLRVLRDVSLTVRAGAVTVVLGRNGAGKTTLLSTIAGLLRPFSGSVVFRGSDITKTSPPERARRGIALVQENKRVFKRRTVEQNLQLGGYSMPRRKAAEAVSGAYDRFPVLGEKRAQRAGELSGGQQQMLAIAQALMPGPALLMLDEPSAGLAPVIVDDVLATVTALKKEGLGILLVEQLVDKAMSVADDVVVVEHGRMQHLPGTGRGADRDHVRAIYLGSTTAALRQ
ncbi:ABC transporter ATP-binding protein [Amycolatopsis rhabdoformis]|uniref:ABC transporter ATP-binding protein n=1 Tax=Amycolatopsis rhabdoformis TaxID=1448059 RepID=A0ABZ1IFJ1_9PSEU|nr:ABC transporter ATP-binding protein [Amycolatopsis rhabdoformis]WSE32230.1 ABC transporter ATP-binding protein [Amycolatopsis rhabdoformis]